MPAGVKEKLEKRKQEEKRSVKKEKKTVRLETSDPPPFPFNAETFAQASWRNIGEQQIGWRTGKGEGH